MILHYCGMKSLVSLSAVCRRLRLSVHSELRHSFKVFLHQYLNNVDAVLTAMRCTGTILSGSAALAWLDRGATWRPNDLDFFCPHDTFFDFTSRLMDVIRVMDYGRFVITSNKHGREYRFRRGVCERVTLLSPKIKIDIYRSVTVSLVYPLPFFHSTLLMNYVSAESFGSAYPALTLQQRGVTHTRLLGVKDVRSISKFCKRGYRFREAVHVWRENKDCWGASTGCPCSIRSFGDAGSLVLTWSSTGDSQLHPLHWNVQWLMGGQPCGGSCVEYRNFWVKCLL